MDPPQQMSFSQRWRAFKFAVKDKKQEIAGYPPFTTIAAAVAAIRALFQPLFDLIVALQKQLETVRENYNQFLAEETKKKWSWSKKNKQEAELLAQVPGYVLGKMDIKTVN